MREIYDLPPKRELVVTEVQRILALGGVQKLVIELGEPIKVDRMVHREDLDAALAVQEDDVYFQIRNAEIADFPPAPSPYETIFRAFHMLSAKELKPRSFVVSHAKALALWLGTAVKMDEFFAVPILEHTEIPEGSLLLTASTPASPEEIVFTLRIFMDDAPKKGKKT